MIKFTENKFFKILAAVFAVFVVVFFAAYVFVQARGKDILVAKMSDAMQKPVTVGSLNVILPLGLEIRDLNVPGYGYVRKARIGSGLFYLFGNYFSFSSLVLTEPHMVVQRTGDKRFVFGEGEPKEGNNPQQVLQGTEGGSPKAEEKPSAKAPGFSFGKVIVKEGKINFLDNSSPENAGRILIDQVNIKAQNVSFPPRDRVTKFLVSGMVTGAEDGGPTGKIESRGWMNLVKKDMNGEVRMENLDGKIFSEYFGGPSLGKNVKSMAVNLSAGLESKNNDMAVKGKVSVDNVVLNKEQDKDAKPSFEDMLLGGLQSIAQGISIDFSFKTKMDRFKIDSFSFSGSIFN